MKEFFRLTKGKVILTIIFSSLLIFFFVPFVFQYCQPVAGSDGGIDGFGGGCGLEQLNTTYPIPSTLTQGNIPAVNFVFYPLSQSLFQEIPLATPPTKITGYPYAWDLTIFDIILAYILSCVVVEFTQILKKQKKPYPAQAKK